MKPYVLKILREKRKLEDFNEYYCGALIYCKDYCAVWHIRL